MRNSVPSSTGTSFCVTSVYVKSLRNGVSGVRNSKNWQHHEHIQFIKDAEMIGGNRPARVAETVEAEAMPAGARLVTSL